VSEGQRTQKLPGTNLNPATQPHLVLDTLIEPAAQQGGGISPPQQDLLSEIEDKLYLL